MSETPVQYGANELHTESVRHRAARAAAKLRAHWAEQRALQEESDRARKAEKDAHDAANLQQTMQVVLGLAVEPTSGVFTLDGLTFERVWEKALRLVYTCPDCGIELKSDRVEGWGSLGIALESWPPASCPNCERNREVAEWEAQGEAARREREHARAEAAAATRRVLSTEAALQTPEGQLLAGLRGLIEQIIDERGER